MKRVNSVVGIGLVMVYNHLKYRKASVLTAPAPHAEVRAAYAQIVEQSAVSCPRDSGGVQPMVAALGCVAMLGQPIQGGQHKVVLR
jgi:hypothetical protein